MSKSSKASPRKKGSTKKKTDSRGASKPEVAKAPVPEKAADHPPLQLSREDQLILQLSFSELQNKRYQLRDANREMEEVNAKWGENIGIVNKKYGLDPTKDKIDLKTGRIEKG